MRTKHHNVIVCLTSGELKALHVTLTLLFHERKINGTVENKYPPPMTDGKQLREKLVKSKPTKVLNPEHEKGSHVMG